MECTGVKRYLAHYGSDFETPKSDVAAYDLAAAPPLAVPGSPATAQRIVLGQKVEAEWWRLLHSRVSHR